MKDKHISRETIHLTFLIFLTDKVTQILLNNNCPFMYESKIKIFIFLFGQQIRFIGVREEIGLVTNVTTNVNEYISCNFRTHTQKHTQSQCFITNSQVNNPLALNNSSTACNTLRYCLGGKKSQEENIKKSVLITTSNQIKYQPLP